MAQKLACYIKIERLFDLIYTPTSAGSAMAKISRGLAFLLLGTLLRHLLNTIRLPSVYYCIYYMDVVLIFLIELIGLQIGILGADGVAAVSPVEVEHSQGTGIAAMATITPLWQTQSVQEVQLKTRIVNHRVALVCLFETA